MFAGCSATGNWGLVPEMPLQARKVWMTSRYAFWTWECGRQEQRGGPTMCLLVIGEDDEEVWWEHGKGLWM